MNTQSLAHYIQQAHYANAQGKFDTAVIWCQRALHSLPNLPEAHYNLAIALHGQGHKGEALDSLYKTAQLAGDNPDALNSIGLLCIEWGALPDAESYLLQSIKLAPEFSFPYSNLGKLREKQGNLTEAESCFRKSLELQPDLAEAYVNLCGILNALKHYNEAETAARRAIAIDPESAEAWSNLSATLCGLKQYEAAETAARRAIAIDPESAEAWSNLGVIYSDQGDFSHGLAYLEKSIGLDKESATSRLNLSIVLLKTGAYDEGFAKYEHRWEGGRLNTRRPDTALPQWRGELTSPSDSILIFSEQGFGDVIQFMRYLPMLKERFQRVAFLCLKSLASLAKANFKDIEIIDSTQDINQKEFQWHCPLLSLALAFKTTLDSIPPAPYLARSQSSLPQTKPAVGFTWRGNPSYDEDRWRSIPLEIYGTLFQNTAIEWVCIQKDTKPEEVTQLPSGSEKAISEAQDFSDTAQLIAKLDLIITIDSAIAHLAGAMGKPVWLLNRANSEWRWGWKKETSPWYPSMRIFNQNEMGKWSPVIKEVSAALTVFTHTHQQR